MASRYPTGKEQTDRLSVFPAFHKVEGRTVLVVGGGDEAAAKVRLIGESRARIQVIAEAVEPALADAAERLGAHLIQRSFQDEDVDGAALVFAASGDADTDRHVVEAARRAGVPANAVDRPDLCDFYTPALVNRAPVAVAISSAGTGPVLARHIRARIEALLPARLGSLARLADSFRGAVAATIARGEDRRRFWARFFAGTVSHHAFAGDLERARSEANRLLNSDNATAGHVWLVGAGPGAEDLLTLRAQRILQEADVIVHDRLVPDAVVAMGRRDAERIAVGKAKGAHSVTQTRINEILVAEAGKGRRVVRLKGGDPMIFGRAGEEMDALRSADIPFEIVPGVTAAIAAASSFALPLTLRRVASSVVFATGHDVNADTLTSWAGLALAGTTVAVYMGKSVAGRVAARLTASGLDAMTPVAVLENVSRRDERAFVGRLGDLTALSERADIEGPVLIVIGAVVRHADLSQAVPLLTLQSEAA
ncbi:MAG: siroheme synthase CysG [Pseudomonadota bacterium]